MLRLYMIVTISHRNLGSHLIFLWLNLITYQKKREIQLNYYKYFFQLFWILCVFIKA